MRSSLSITDILPPGNALPENIIVVGLDAPVSGATTAGTAIKVALIV